MVNNYKIDERARGQWDKSCYSYNNYITYVETKPKYNLTYLDLLHVSNFKGGNATINDTELNINKKLLAYSDLFKVIDETFGNKAIEQLNEEELMLLIKQVNEVCNLAALNKITKIDGLGMSYLSALLHFHFPNLIPILDRRVLISSGIVKYSDRDSQDQIKNIANFYAPLIQLCAKSCKEKKMSIRDFDKDLFIRDIPKKPSVEK